MRPWLGIVLALALPASALSAIPDPAATFSAHDHATPGDGWHVELRTGRDPSVLEGVVVHAERCGGNTPFASGVPVGEDGSVAHSGPLDPRDPEAGAWSVEARFTETHRADGSFRIATPGCDTGPMPFVAHAGGHPHGTSFGPPHGTMPVLSQASRRRLGQARRLHRRTLRSARRLFPTLRSALRRGYMLSEHDAYWKRPQVFHVRHGAYTRDREYFDARRPEALVYHRPRRGRPVLVAFMYRYPLGPWPRFARPLLAWHSHGKGVWYGVPNQMTHVWLTGDLRSALANCLPVAQLEASIRGYRFAPPDRLDHESQPCPDRVSP